MTGEITLKGLVLPIGGLKEKALAAQRAGITRVIAPARNEPDIEDFPANLMKEVEFLFLDNADEVLDEALEPPGGLRTRRRGAAAGAPRPRGRQREPVAAGSGVQRARSG
jgi:ATP-dependent Lon protease